MKNFMKAFIMIALALVCVCTTGCGKDDVVKAASNAKETVMMTASNAKKEVKHWTRHTDKQSWVNSTGTKVKIEERRKEGDFKITITYSKEDLNGDNRENVKPTGDAIIIMYVDSISEELMDELQSY